MGSLESALLRTPDGQTEHVHVSHMVDIQNKRKRYASDKGWPMICALASGANEVHLWPTPHAAGEIKLEYYPPLEEI